MSVHLDTYCILKFCWRMQFNKSCFIIPKVLCKDLFSLLNHTYISQQQKDRRGSPLKSKQLVFKLTLTATAPSSTNFTFTDLDLDIGPSMCLGIGGLSNAPLYLIMNIRPPK